MASAQGYISQSVISVLTGKLISSVSCVPIAPSQKEIYIQKLSALPSDARLAETLSLCRPKITPTDMKYLLCFYVGMATADISRLFNIDIHSVYTVRYRIRKKLKGGNGMELILI